LEKKFKFKKLTVVFMITFLFLVVGCYFGLEKVVPEDSEIGKTIFVLKNVFNKNIITKVDTGDKKLVALTVDDGPDPRFTPKVLAILKKYHCQATFFVVGRFAVLYPDLIKREVMDGHEIENHTYSHPDLQKDSGLKVDEEISENQSVILTLTNRRSVFFRPPKALFNREVVDIASAKGYKIVLWTVCVEHHRSKTIQDMAQRVIKRAQPGIIILAHDGRLDRTRTIEALPLIIQGYQKRGYRFVTLEQLVKNQVKTKG
jgi:peptidoglycan/xylan/chitin deacetylase (PgdA/CDA1 family)